MKDGSMVIFCIKDVIWYTEHRILWCYNVVGTIPKWWNNPLLIFIWYTEWLNDGDHHQNFQHQWGWILWVYDHHQPIRPIILKPFLSVDFYINTVVCSEIYIYMWLSHHSLTSLFYHILSSEWITTPFVEKNCLSTDWKFWTIPQWLTTSRGCCKSHGISMEWT